MCSEDVSLSSVLGSCQTKKFLNLEEKELEILDENKSIPSQWTPSCVTRLKVSGRAAADVIVSVYTIRLLDTCSVEF
jgi:hypothetical protein